MSKAFVPGRRVLLLAGGAALLARPSLAQVRFPDRPIRVLVPWTPGGATDIQMRSVCDQASRRLGQPVIVENKPGASGTLGALYMAREGRPDGYTLGQMPNGVFRMPAMVDRPQWDPTRDFSWIFRLVGYMGGVVVRPDAPWHSMQVGTSGFSSPSSDAPWTLSAYSSKMVLWHWRQVSEMRERGSAGGCV